jgi:hypothetical protein
MMVRLVPRSLEPGGYGTGREHDRGHGQGPEGRVGNGSEYGPASAGPSDQDPGRGFRLLTLWIHCHVAMRHGAQCRLRRLPGA